jgi:glycosyltransferase involved in cell wall biosynthesis
MTEAALRGRKAVHISSAHPAFDNRIFVKECRSLAAAGYRVHLVVPHDRDETVDGVTICAVEKGRGRLGRFALGGWRVFRRALRERGDLYHFHDPELIVFGLLLGLLTGRPVVYDVHEPYRQSIASRRWLPQPLRSLAVGVYAGLEWVARKRCALIIAERYYARWLPEATLVLNYPRLEAFADLQAIPPQRPPAGSIRLLYTGVLYRDRGAMTYAALAARLEGTEVKLVGYCPGEVAAAMRTVCDDPKRLVVEGIDEHLPHERVIAAYHEPWTAALVLMFDLPNYREKELTKFFEYMAAGLPMIATRTPTWQGLVEGTGVGICVDPDDLDEVVAAVRSLAADPARAAAMGEAGRRAVEERFSWASQARNLEDLYERLLG